MCREEGQATVEWVGTVLLVALALGGAGGLAAQALGFEARSFGGLLAHRIACAAKGGCDDGHAPLARAYGEEDARLLRAHAPGLVYERGEAQLPVDYRRCRERSCADGPDADMDVHRSHRGERATVFAHVVRRGGRTYLQYWLYYPDSNTAWAGSDKLWERSYLAPLIGRLLRGEPGYPGFHADDWEGHSVRLDADGGVSVRSTSHGHWQACKARRCRGRWTRGRGWTRVSRGSHAGHVPPRLSRGERTTSGEGLRLVPLEPLEGGSYEARDPAVLPPWRKEAYRDPEDDTS